MARNESEIGLDRFIDERDSLIALARSFVGSTDVAEDIVQDSWIRWQTNSYPAERATPLFRVIVANLARDWFRSQKRQRQNVETQTLLQEFEVDSERIVIARQDLKRVVRALGTLSKRSRLALKLHRIDGMTYRQIGDRLNISYARAFQLVSQALAQAAMAMED